MADIRHSLIVKNPMLFAASAVAVGIGLADVSPLVSLLFFYGSAPLLFLLAIVFRRVVGLAGPLVWSGLLLLGCGRMMDARQMMAIDDAESHTFMGIVMSDARQHAKTCSFDLEITEGQARGFVMRIFVKKSEKEQPRLGDLLRVSGKVERNDEQTDHFNRWDNVGRMFLRQNQWQRMAFDESRFPLYDRLRYRFLNLRLMAKRQQKSLSSNYLRFYKGNVLDSMSQQSIAILQAVSIGDRGSLTAETRQLFNRSGTAHLLSLSGLHLGIIFGWLVLLLTNRRLGSVHNRIVSHFSTGWRERLRPVVYVFIYSAVILGVWWFALVAGFSASTVRAALMLSVFLCLDIAGRKAVSLNTLSFVFVALLLFSPMQWHDVGFWMSFLSVGALVVVMPWFSKVAGDTLPYRWWSRALHWILGMVVVTFVAQIVVIPVASHCFGGFATYSSVVNLLAIPLITIVLYGSLLFQAICLAGADEVATALLPLLVHLVTMLTVLLDQAASLPGSYITYNMNAIQMAAYAITVCAILCAVYVIVRVKLCKTRAFTDDFP